MPLQPTNGGLHWSKYCKRQKFLYVRRLWKERWTPEAVHITLLRSKWFSCERQRLCHCLWERQSMKKVSLVCLTHLPAYLAPSAKLSDSDWILCSRINGLSITVINYLGFFSSLIGAHQNPCLWKNWTAKRKTFVITNTQLIKAADKRLFWLLTRVALYLRFLLTKKILKKAAPRPFYVIPFPLNKLLSAKETNGLTLLITNDSQNELFFRFSLNKG